MDLSLEDRALLALRLVAGIGPRTLSALLSHFGSAQAALAADVESLSQVPHVSREVARSLKDSWEQGKVENERALMDRHGVSLRCLSGPDFPPSLVEVAGGPALLYIKGTLLPADIQAIALVGSRGCTGYGRRMAYRIANDLAAAGYTIVSGLARGIDAEAHKGALDAGGRTLAVLANGLGRVYPPEHADLAERIAASGALISESAMLMEPLPGMFPARNRIISGLSRAVIVVEAGDKSGALITARHAGEQGREVFVLPGNVDSVANAGSLELLRNGAKLIRHARDVLEDLQGVAPLFELASVKPEPQLQGLAAQLWKLLVEPRSIDDLCHEASGTVAELSAALLMMEVQGIVRKQPGGVYERYNE